MVRSPSSRRSAALHCCSQTGCRALLARQTANYYIHKPKVPFSLTTTIPYHTLPGWYCIPDTGQHLSPARLPFPPPPVLRIFPVPFLYFCFPLLCSLPFKHQFRLFHWLFVLRSCGFWRNRKMYRFTVCKCAA